MTFRTLVRVWVFGTLLTIVPSLAHGQETVLSGSIVDATDAVLPGVAVTAVHVDSGNTFVGVTDASGQYRIGALRTGSYRITAELQGFTSAVRESVQLLLGQRATVNFRLTLSTVQETVTVTSEAPLLETSLSKLGGNVDPRQVESLPVNGRNWMDLTMLTPGSRVNAVRDDVATPTTPSGGMSFQVNMDGQQMTNTIIVGSQTGQPQMSRDAIAEFEFVANRFDATQGRSAGVQINAITKSGTNDFAGTASGYFRSDKFNAADFIVGTVLPYSNQQISTTFGGPIRRDRVHFFANYEYERQPQTFTFTSPFPAFNAMPLESVFRTDKGTGKLDVQFSNNTRLMGRLSGFKYNIPFQPHPPAGGYGATLHPSAGGSGRRDSLEGFVTITQVFGQKINEVKGGYFIYNQRAGTQVTSPLIQLRGYSIGPPFDWPQHLVQSVYQFRDDFTFSVDARGRHELKVGGEYLHKLTDFKIDHNNLKGTIDATGGPIPANIEALFPVWNNPSTWNIAALSPITVRYTQSIAASGTGAFENPKKIGALFVQDNWAVTDSLTLNLGLRWDWEVGALAEKLLLSPFLVEERSYDWNNVQPRLGFAYAVGNATVVRGGFGQYYPEQADQPNWQTQRGVGLAGVLVANDGRPDFASNPFNGAIPTFAQAAAVRPRNLASAIVSPDIEFNYSWQGSLGVQRQLGATVSAQADYVFTGTRDDHYGRQINLSYNPATGAPFPFTDVTKRPFGPEFGSVAMIFSGAQSNYHGLQTALTKRFSDSWQASATYTLGFLKDEVPPPTGPCFIGGAFEPCPSSFTPAPDLGAEYAYAAGDQRHRAVLNGIWDIPFGFQLSGLYFFGSGQRFATGYGADLRGNLTNPGVARLRPDGSLVPRNNFVGDPLHRVDLRIMRRTSIGRGVSVDGILEVFNLFNHENYGSYVTVETNRLYGQPAQNNNVAYAPRMLQLGFRVAF